MNKNDIQTDLIRGQLMRRNLLLQKQREKFFKELRQLREQIFQKDRLVDYYQADDWGSFFALDDMDMDESSTNKKGNDGADGGGDAATQQQLEDMKKQFDKEKQKLKMQYESQIRDLTASVERLTKELKDKELLYQRTIEKLKADHQLEVDQLNFAHEAQIKSMESAFEKERIEWEERKQREMAELVSQFEAQLEAARKELEVVTTKLNKEIDNLKREVANKQNVIDELNDRISSAMEELERTKAAMQEFMEEKIRLEAEVAAQAVKIAEQEAAMAGGRAEMEKLKLQNEDISRQLKEAKDELQRMSGMDLELEKLRKDNDQLRKKVDELIAKGSMPSTVVHAIAAGATPAAALSGAASVTGTAGADYTGSLGASGMSGVSGFGEGRTTSVSGSISVTAGARTGSLSAAQLQAAKTGVGADGVPLSAAALQQLKDAVAKDEKLKKAKMATGWQLMRVGMSIADRHANRVSAMKLKALDVDSEDHAERREIRQLNVFERLERRANLLIEKLRDRRALLERERQKNLERALMAVCLLVKPQARSSYATTNIDFDDDENDLFDRSDFEMDTFEMSAVPTPSHATPRTPRTPRTSSAGKRRPASRAASQASRHSAIALRSSAPSPIALTPRPATSMDNLSSIVPMSPIPMMPMTPRAPPSPRPPPSAREPQRKATSRVRATITSQSVTYAQVEASPTPRAGEAAEPYIPTSYMPASAYAQPPASPRPGLHIRPSSARVTVRLPINERVVQPQYNWSDTVDAGATFTPRPTSARLMSPGRPPPSRGPTTPRGYTTTPVMQAAPTTDYLSMNKNERREAILSMIYTDQGRAPMRPPSAGGSRY
eukprot:TRINITY_DN7492_c0_g1_i1.p1 TRINITY_DN7492_c0_g1~~TRINITY_DN7492_c0_g1_i1.p1  ORF type:complete len:837 (-),score=237.52 TRINITY_DN7492_c0_g1_i1:156-2666(-)